MTQGIELRQDRSPRPAQRLDWRRAPERRTRSRLLSPIAAVLIAVLAASIDLRPALAGTDEALSNYWSVTNENLPPDLDADTLSALFAEDAIMRHPFGELPDGPLQGRAQIRDFFAQFGQRYRTWRHVEDRRDVAGSVAVSEGYAEGTSATSGATLRIPMLFIMTFNTDGLVEEQRVFFNLERLRSQLQ